MIPNSKSTKASLINCSYNVSRLTSSPSAQLFWSSSRLTCACFRGFFLGLGPADPEPGGPAAPPADAEASSSPLPAPPAGGEDVAERVVDPEELPPESGRFGGEGAGCRSRCAADGTVRTCGCS